MKQVFLSGKGQIELFEAPLPSRMQNSVLVRTAYSLISAGTEGAAVTRSGGIVGLYEKFNNSRDRLDQVWHMAKSQGLGSTIKIIDNKLGDYLPLGYSNAGVVLETDNSNLGFRAGDRVACMGAGLANHSEYVCVPKNLVVKLPDSVRFQEAAFGAIACIAMQGIRRLELQPGERVAVVGLGLIGQIAFRLASCMGFQPHGFDIDQDRVDTAARHGGSETVSNSNDVDLASLVDNVTNSQGFDGVVVCASGKSDTLINQTFDMCRKRGRVSIVGDIGLGLKRAKMYAKELEVRLSCSYGVGRYDPDYELGGIDYPMPYVRWTERRNLEYFLELLASGQLNINDLVSETFPIEQANNAYALIKTNRTDIFGVLLDYALPETPSIPKSGRVVYYKEQANTHKEKISLGLIGVGAYAKNIHIPNLMKDKRVLVGGIASKIGGSAAVVAKKTNAAFATSDSAKLIEDDDIDAIIISTRHSTHADLVIEALKAGKHVFVEKPMATTVNDCLEIEDLQAKTGLVVRVGFNRRFAPMLQAMKRYIGAGQKLFTQRVSVGNVGMHWSNTIEEGGRLLGEGAHFFDLANWMMDDYPETVTAEFIGEASALNPNVNITLKYPNGSISSIIYTSLGSSNGSKEHFEIYGNNRNVTIDDYRSIKAYGRTIPLKGVKARDKGQSTIMSEFISACKNDPCTNGANVEAGLWSTLIFEAAIESAKHGKCIELNGFLSQLRHNQSIGY